MHANTSVPGNMHVYIRYVIHHRLIRSFLASLLPSFFVQNGLFEHITARISDIIVIHSNRPAFLPSFVTSSRHKIHQRRL